MNSSEKLSKNIIDIPTQIGVDNFGILNESPTSENYQNSMTTCIALLADDGKSVVVATDKMLSINVAANTPYELDDDRHKKIIELNSRIVVLIAGNIETATAIFSQLKIDESLQPLAATEAVRKAYAQYVLDAKEKNILQPIALTWERYFKEQSSMNQAIVNDIHKKLQDYNCGVEVVVAGQDSTTNLCHIFLVGLSGVSFDKTDAGFATIGSGWSIATFTILQSGFNKSKKLTEIEALAKKVMQEASHAPGVGKLTESLVLPKTKPKE